MIELACAQGSNIASEGINNLWGGTYCRDHRWLRSTHTPNANLEHDAQDF
jgi:hypothetical protein